MRCLAAAGSAIPWRILDQPPRLRLAAMPTTPPPLRPSHVALIIAAILALGIATSALLPGADAATPTVIRLGFATVGLGGVQAVGYSAVGTAQIKGLLEAEFAKDGIQIQWNFYRGAGPAVNEALANGLLDFAWQGDFPAIIGKANGLPTRIILAAGQRSNSYLAVPAGSTATKLEDLVGKKVGFHKGTNMQLVVEKALAEHGLKEKDFLSINIDALAGLAAISAKELDGLWGNLELIELERSGAIRFVYSTRDQSPTLTKQTHLLVTEAFEQAHPAIVQRLVTLLVREAAWESEDRNRGELFQLWTKMGLPATTWEGEFSGTSLKLRQSPLLDDFFIARYREGVVAALDFKLIRSSFDVGPWFDPRYVRTAVHELKLDGYWQEFDDKGKPLTTAH
jgi:sulfonate transport system substrate-binding protein